MPLRKMTATGLLISVALCVVVILAIPFEGAFSAGNIMVTTADDEINSDGDCSLREAVQAANTNASVDACSPGSDVLADEIIFADLSGSPDVYTLGITGTDEDSNATGDLDITESVSIIGNGQTETIIQAGTQGPLEGPNGIDRVFNIVEGDATFSGVTIRYGNVVGSGGGILANDTSNLMISDSAVIFSTSRVDVDGNLGDGGGIRASEGLVTLTNSTIRNNHAERDGGGMSASVGPVDAELLVNVSVVLTNSNIRDNVAGRDGGGINTFEGGVRLADSTVSDNKALGNTGGGVKTSDGLVEVKRSTISGNTAEDDGGGIRTSDGDVAVVNSTISGNRAKDDGGGIRTSDGNVTVVNSTISSNTAQDPDDLDDGRGGGIRTSGGAVTGIVEMMNATVVNNHAAQGGGGIYADTIKLKNTILFNNNFGDAAPFAQENCSSPVSATDGTNGRNISSDDSCGLDTLSGDLENVTDPGLGPLQDNGGLTKTHALLPGSPAIDRIPEPDCEADLGTSPVDQRGVDRPQGAACDIGAFEKLNQPPVANAGGPYGVHEGASETLSGIDSFDPDDDFITLTFEWDLDYDGITFDVDAAGDNVPFDATGLDGPSSRSVALRVTDPSGASNITTAIVSIVNKEPMPNGGPDQSVFRNEIVTVNGVWADPAGSLDNPYSWSWDLDGDGLIDASGTAIFGDTIQETAVFPTEGVYTLTFEVTDKDGDRGSDSIVVEVLNQPPDCLNSSPSVDRLWPPNHKFTSIEITGVTDADGDTISITIDSIFQDEAVDAPGSGNTSPDGKGVGTSTAEVRAERAGGGNGRVYHIGYTASDVGHDGSCSREVLVSVPKSQGKNGAAIDDGALFDSTQVH
jgi:CSLREA domain-containing protein